MRMTTDIPWDFERDDKTKNAQNAIVEKNDSTPDVLDTLDAYVWANEFIKTRHTVLKEREEDIADDEGTLLAWFANAIMKGYDNGKGRQTISDMIDIQCSDGNWNYSEYMLGLANGLIAAASCIDGTDPVYLDAPDVWMEDIPIEFNEGSVSSEDSFERAMKLVK